jgi:predicted GIY-YIG superfamily endonuclease
MNGYIYVLHFETRLHHAGHYLGSTYNLDERFARHAAGQAARLTQVLAERRMTWSVAAVYECTIDCRLAEREAKRRKNTTTYCPKCNPEHVAPSYTREIPFQWSPKHEQYHDELSRHENYEQPVLDESEFPF